MSPIDFLSSEERFDLVVNVDSMPEMSIEFICDYFQKICSVSDTFLSINHEFNAHTVANAAQSIARLERTARVPYWMRRGYVEELFRVRRQESA